MVERGPEKAGVGSPILSLGILIYVSTRNERFTKTSRFALFSGIIVDVRVFSRRDARSKTKEERTLEFKEIKSLEGSFEAQIQKIKEDLKIYFQTWDGKSVDRLIYIRQKIDELEVLTAKQRIAKTLLKTI